MPINESEIVWDETPKIGDILWDEIPQKEIPQEGLAGQALETAKSVGEVYPALETAATLATSTYGIPLSGLAALFTLPFGLEKSEKALKGVQKALVYQPQTKRGKQLLGATTYPMQKLEEAGEYVGEKIEKKGHPYLAATAKSAVIATPILATGAKILTKPFAAKQVKQLDSKISQTITRGINKAIRPSVSKKEMYGQVTKYRKQAKTTVEEIIKNKDQLNLVDSKGRTVEGLPQNLDQFSQAIEQTKRSLFEEYDALIRETEKPRFKRDLTYPMKEGETAVLQKGEYPIITTKGVDINLNPVALELRKIIKNKTLQDLSPETIDYAVTRIEALKTRGKYSARETQEAIQFLNESLENYYRDPTPTMKGRALVDSLIANHLRKQLDMAIQNVTGKEYQVLKTKYGALREIERDVTKRAIVDARKNVKGLIDFSDVYTGYHIVKGVLAMEPSTLTAGAVAKAIAHYIKVRNDPNRMVKSMFKDAESLIKERNQLGVITR